MSESREQKDYLFHCWEKNSHLKIHTWADLESAFEKGKIIPSSWKGWNFFRINKEFKGLPVGTFFDDRILVRGYPSIPRVYILKTGLKRYFSEPFYAEEKIEGYNVRLIMVGSEILAFTRRGYVCPFATDRWIDFLPELPKFFKEFPNYVICCEVAGPENPFVSEWPPYIKEDIKFFVFDIAKMGTGEFISVEEKLNLLQFFNFPHPEIHGPFDSEKDYKKICTLIRRYHTEGREGLVFKPLTRGSRVKYVTPYSNLADLRIVFPYLGEIESNYISLRLIRLFLNIYEFEEFKEEIYRSLGETLFENALQILRNKNPFEETFQVRFKREENFLALLAHFKIARVTVEILHREWRDGYHVIKFRKIYPRATQFWTNKLEGWGEVD